MADWSVMNMRKRVDKFMEDLGLPSMEKPNIPEGDYPFPTDVSSLRSDDLGSLSLKLSGWYSWTVRVIGREESIYDAFEETFNTRVWAEVAEQRRIVNLNVKTALVLTKEEIRAKIIREDDELARLNVALIEKKMIITELKGYLNSYSESIQRLSREQSRRDSEARLM